MAETSRPSNEYQPFIQPQHSIPKQMDYRSRLLEAVPAMSSTTLPQTPQPPRYPLRAYSHYPFTLPISKRTAEETMTVESSNASFRQPQNLWPSSIEKRNRILEAVLALSSHPLPPPPPPLLPSYSMLDSLHRKVSCLRSPFFILDNNNGSMEPQIYNKNQSCESSNLNQTWPFSVPDKSSIWRPHLGLYPFSPPLHGQLFNSPLSPSYQSPISGYLQPQMQTSEFFRPHISSSPVLSLHPKSEVSNLTHGIEVHDRNAGNHHRKEESRTKSSYGQPCLHLSHKPKSPELTKAQGHALPLNLSKVRFSNNQKNQNYQVRLQSSSLYQETEQIPEDPEPLSIAVNLLKAATPHEALQRPGPVSSKVKGKLGRPPKRATKMSLPPLYIFIRNLLHNRCQFHQHFYEQILCTKVFCAAFLYLQFGFVILWQINIDAKSARKVLVKLTTGPTTHRLSVGSMKLTASSRSAILMSLPERGVE